MSKKHNNHRSGLFGPFILIAVGVIFLFQNLGLLNGSVWENLVRFWPLLLILLGINDLLKSRGIVGPTFAISLGAIFMAHNLNIISWTSWMSILRLWPVIIIAIGLEIFIGRKNIWLSAVGVGASISLLVLGLWFSGGVIASARSPRTGDPLLSEEITQPLGRAKSARVKIDSSLGQLSVDSLSNDDSLIEGVIYSVEQEKIYQEYEIDGKEITYALGSDWEPGNTSSFSNFDEKKLSWELNLTEEIPLDLKISLDVGASDIDLSNLKISDLDLSIGVGQTEIELPEGEYDAFIEGGVGQTRITLPDEGQIELDVSGGVGEILIYIPEDAAVKIYVDRGIAGLSVPASYTQSDNIYTSPNYDKHEEYFELYLEQGIGNIAIREK